MGIGKWLLGVFGKRKQSQSSPVAESAELSKPKQVLSSRAFFTPGGLDVQAERFADVMMERARGLIENGSKEQACAVLEVLVGARPEFGPAWHWLGVTLLQAGNLVRARQALENAKRLSPQNKEVDKSIFIL